MNTKIILPLFLASIMIFSILGFAFNSYQSDNASKVKFKGRSFNQVDQGWVTYLNNQPILISQSPEALNPITLPEVSLASINSANKIYFTLNPEENLQSSLYYFNLNIRPKLKNFIIACIEDNEQCADLPLKTCEDTELYTKIIQVNLANESSVTYNNNCLHIQGQKQEITKLMDALVLKLLL